MKQFKFLLKIFLLITATSCVISFSQGTDHKFMQKTIDGKNYTFLSEIRISNKNILGFKSRNFEANIMFSGIGERPFRDNISFDNFEKKAKVKIPENVIVDSISFTVNKTKDNIKLIYYLSNMVLPLKVSFNLEYDGEEWVLEK